VQVFFENDRLIFQPDTALDRRELVDWWVQLQALGDKPAVSSVTVEKALVIYLPQR
jgi:hypothetical protein